MEQFNTRVMKHVSKHAKNIQKHVVKHLKQHHKKYLFGAFWWFAIVKMILLFAGFIGLLNYSGTFAAGGITVTGVTFPAIHI